MTQFDIAKMAGQVEVSSCLAEVEIKYKTKVKPMNRPKIVQSKEMYDYFLTLFSPDTLEHHEEMFVFVLNRASRILGWAKLSSGGLAGTVCDARIIGQIALLSNAQSIILAHNHPSGELKPSETDIKLTRTIRDALKLFDIQLLDHLIITTEGYTSMADEGLF